MAESTVDILIRARDEATQTINQAMSRLNQATLEATRNQGQLVTSIDKATVAATSFSRQISGTSASARFLGFTVIGELAPALGTGASRLASLASVAAISGTVVGALATVGIGGLVIALTSFIRQAKKAREEQEALNKVLTEGKDAAIAASLASFRKQEVEQLERITKLREAETKALLGRSGIAVEIENQERRLGQIRENIFDITRRLNVETIRKLEGDRRVAEQTEKVSAVTREAEADLIAFNRAVLDTTRSESERFKILLAITQLETKQRAEEELRGIKELEDAEKQAAVTALARAEDELKKRGDLATQFRRFQLSDEESFAAAEQIIRQREAAEGLALLRESLDGQRELLIVHSDLMARHGRDAGEQFAGGLQSGILIAQEQMGTFGHNVQGIVVGSAQAWARGLDDAFFAVITGKTKDLADVFKQMGAAILRELTGTFARLATGSILRSLEGAFGLAPGRLGGFSPAAMGAMIPGGPGIPGLPGTGADLARFVPPVFAGGPAISFAGTTVPTAEILREAGLGGIGASQALGAAASILGGLLFLASSFQATSPGMGALAGGLGGLSIAAGLSALGVGSFSMLGPIGAIAGALLGAIGGIHGRRRQRRARARQEAELRIFNAFMKWLDDNLPTLTPRQILQLIVYLRDGTPPTDERLLRVIELGGAIGVTFTGQPGGGPGLRALILQHGGHSLLQEMIDMLFDALFEFDIERILENVEDLRAFAPGIRLFEVEIPQPPPPDQVPAPMPGTPGGIGGIGGAASSLGSMTQLASDVEIAQLTDRIRNVSSLMGIPMLPEARFRSSLA